MVVAQYNADHNAAPAEMTIKITGYQWMWRYEYVDKDVNFISRLDRESDRIRQAGGLPDAKVTPHYLRDVDRPLVLPADTRIRFVITADDVIHAWWVPALGWKQDAIPGVINEAWTQVAKPAPTAASARNCAARTMASCRSWSRSCRSRNTTPGWRTSRPPNSEPRRPRPSGRTAPATTVAPAGSAPADTKPLRRRRLIAATPAEPAASLTPFESLHSSKASDMANYSAAHDAVTTTMVTSRASSAVVQLHPTQGHRYLYLIFSR
jgi:cytochrome c oxidase subunit 2